MNAMSAFSRKLFTFLLNLGLLAAVASFGYYYRAEVGSGLRILELRFLPCWRPIDYSIGAVDERFKLTQADFQAVVAEAAKMWEEPIGRQFFVYAADGRIKVNLTYDYRQEATDKLRKLGFNISTDEKSYKSLKSKYESLKAEYDEKKASYETDSKAFDARKAAYEKEVATWNAKGGAPTDAFSRLETERISLRGQADQLNVTATDLNRRVDEINALVTTLNRLAASLNITVDKYDQVVGGRGTEFQEARYRNDVSGESIDVYEYDDRTSLVRVIMHEMGHALGLEHSENPEDVMYRLNQGKVAKPSAGDIKALKDKCRIGG